MKNQPVVITEPAALAALKEIYENNGPGYLEWDFSTPGQVTAGDGRLEAREGALTRLNLNRAKLKGTLKLGGVETLAVLTADENGFGGIDLEGLPGLRELTLRDNRISDVQSLAKLSGLTGLFLRGNQVRDIGPLAKLSGLTRLGLGDNELISDLKPLAGLTALEELHVGGNQIVDLAPLARLTALRELDVQRNHISDFGPLAGLKNLKVLSYRGNCRPPGEEIKACAMTGRAKPILEEKKAGFNPALVNTDTDLAKLTERVLNCRFTAFSLCLFGAPGTGKSEYARHLAGRMGLEVLHKRGSDLFSMWLGESEKKIAAAFEEARTDKKFLIFDEADSFLHDRALAVRSWEVTQVNEMLTWMESHPYPFACTTNLMDRLDQASLRRFTFKVKYDYLTLDQARLAFRHFFGLDYEIKLEALTPGDFTLAARKAAILGLSEPAELAELLAQEQEAKGVKSAGIGFIS